MHKNLKLELVEILNKHNFHKMTEIQQKTLPDALAKRDIIGISKTGSGKTLSFLIPILNSLIRKNVSFHSLILIPTRELALQINNLLLDLGDDLGLRTSLLIGGEDFNIQKMSLNRNPHVLIGTPGRVAEHNIQLKSLRFIVLDETDKLLENNFKNDILSVFKKLLKEKNLTKEQISKKNFQTFLFSATLKSEFDNFINEILFEPKIVELQNKIEIDEKFIFIPYKYKIIYLIKLIKKFTPESCIVFTNSSTKTRIISECLKAANIQNQFLYGDLDFSKRKGAILSFRKGDFPILVSTDVASRGLDIPQVDLIINFDICDSETYTHRIGRTSRNEKIGSAISLVSQYEIISFQKIEFELNRKIEDIMAEDVTESEHELVDVYDKVKAACKEVRKQEAIEKRKYKKKTKNLKNK